jgi:hypothetical protein
MAASAAAAPRRKASQRPSRRRSTARALSGNSSSGRLEADWLAVGHVRLEHGGGSSVDRAMKNGLRVAGCGRKYLVIAGEAW